MKHSKTNGFTIIEVIIVLVIGAVIMLAVFLVVPQLQREQRNRRRQADARNILQAGEQFSASNGLYPASGSNTGNLKCAYSAGGINFTAVNCPSVISITGDIKTPEGGIYANVQGIPSSITKISVTYDKNRCDSNASATAGVTNEKKFVVIVPQETISSAIEIFCLNAQGN